MCMQCAAGAMTAVAGASGARAWLAGRATPRALRTATAVLAAGAVVASATLLG